MTARRSRVVGLGAVLCVTMSWAAPNAEAEDVGRAEITPSEGGSSTAFSVRIPEGSTCPGDSADDGYRVNSYMVPVDIDPATVPFDGLGPTPIAYGDYATFREPLFDLDTNSYVSAQTADAEEPGQPGTIINVPDFSYAVYQPGDLPAGRYHLGIACTLRNEIVTVWDAEVAVTEAADDEPAQIRWEVVGATATAGGDSGLSTAAVVAAGAAAIVLLAALVRRRRPRQPIATSVEEL